MYLPDNYLFSSLICRCPVLGFCWVAAARLYYVDPNRIYVYSEYTYCNMITLFQKLFNIEFNQVERSICFMHCLIAHIIL